ncbi:hypothetical protein O3M35_011142 [Rhynocoris fuscipes]|uniref:Sodium-coupled monocarboxylate transporter 1 n=1 Tax=Rhynocoris fuscipes TaxID=488301 RepID=A0AAW1CVH8_9HEMI
MVGNGASFAWYEYVVFSSMFVATAAIGIYFGCSKKKSNNTVQEYMFGGGNMPILPIALSLIASFGSGLNLLGLPAEIYVYGTQIGAVIISIILATVILNLFILPLLYNLNSTSMFEYLERRFNKTARNIGALLYIFTLLNAPTIIYAPSLAFSQVSGVSLNYIVPVIVFFCIFYTTLGGLKAVTWSDALQSGFIAASMITVLILGLFRTGGIGHVISIAEEGERLEFFNFDIDPTARNTFWTVVIGMTFTWVKFLAMDPVSFQRYTSVATYKQAQRVTWIMCAGIIITKLICITSGLIIYAYYKDCDPIMTKAVSKPGQILPYYALDIAGKYPGFNGIFLSGVIGTALSSLSTCLNTLSGSLLDDFIRPMSPWKITDTMASAILKISVVILGIISGALVFVVARMGTILQGAIALNGIASGATLFIYTYGMFYPWGNAKGAVSGSLAAIAASMWIAIGAQVSIENGDLQQPGKLMSISGCSANQTLPEGLNITTSGFSGYGTKVLVSNGVPYLFRLSYLYYTVFGMLVGFLVGIIVSYLTGNQDFEKLNPNLIVPQLRSLLKKNDSKEKSYENIELIENKIQEVEKLKQ